MFYSPENIQISISCNCVFSLLVYTISIFDSFKGKVDIKLILKYRAESRG
jgi:hypothetical protein